MLSAGDGGEGAEVDVLEGHQADRSPWLFSQSIRRSLSIARYDAAWCTAVGAGIQG